MTKTSGATSRRTFLRRSVALSALPPLIAGHAAVLNADHSADAGLTGAPVLHAEHRRALVVLLTAHCPDLERYPEAADALAASIEDLLRTNDAGAVARQQLFLEALSAADAASTKRFGGPVTALARDEADALFAAMRAGALDEHFPLRSWTDDLIRHLLPAASLSGAAYSQFESRLFWVLFA